MLRVHVDYSTHAHNVACPFIEQYPPSRLLERPNTRALTVRPSRLVRDSPRGGPVKPV